MTTKHHKQQSPDEAITNAERLADVSMGTTLLAQFLRQQAALYDHASPTDYAQWLALMPFFMQVAKGVHPQQVQLQNQLDCNDIHLKKAAMRAIKALYLDHVDDPCRVLGLNPWASLEEGQHRYRQLIRLFHPDRNILEDQAIADAMTANLNLAYQQFTAHEAKHQPLSPNKKRAAATRPSRPTPAPTSRPASAHSQQATARAKKQSTADQAAPSASRQTTAHAAPLAPSAFQATTSAIMRRIKAAWLSLQTPFLTMLNGINIKPRRAQQTYRTQPIIGFASYLSRCLYTGLGTQV
jgi:hypothetical protein